MLSHTWKPENAVLDSTSTVTLHDMLNRPVTMAAPPVISGGLVTVYVHKEGSYKATIKTKNTSYVNRIDVNDPSNDVPVSGYIPYTARGASNGVAPLDSDIRIPDSFMPSRLSAAVLPLDARNYGVVGDGVTDDTVNMRKFFAALAARGGVGVSSGKFLITGQINMVDPKPFTYDGQNSTEFIFRHTTDTSSLQITRPINVHLKNFTSSHGFNVTGFASHGIVFVTPKDSSVTGVKMSGWKNTGILFYGAGSRGNTIGDCNLTGLNMANNGILHETTVGSKILDCNVFDLGYGAPGYGLQLKNNCQNCTIQGGSVTGATAGVAFGQEGGVGVTDSAVIGVTVRNCKLGFIAGYAKRNRVDMGIDMENNSLMTNAVRLEYSDDNLVAATVSRTVSPKHITHIANSNRNTVNIQATPTAVGGAGDIRPTSTYNKVTYSYNIAPGTISDTSGNATNSVTNPAL